MPNIKPPIPHKFLWAYGYSLVSYGLCGVYRLIWPQNDTYLNLILAITFYKSQSTVTEPRVRVYMASPAEGGARDGSTYFAHQSLEHSQLIRFDLIWYVHIMYTYSYHVYVPTPRLCRIRQRNVLMHCIHLSVLVSLVCQFQLSNVQCLLEIKLWTNLSLHSMLYLHSSP